MRRVVAVFVVLVVIALSPERAAAAQASPPPPVLEVGESVPGFDTTALDGMPHKVDFSNGRTTVLLFFMSSCGTCHKMIPVWNDAYPRRGEDVDVVGVIVDREPPGFFEMVRVTFPVIRSPGRSLLDAYKLRKVPMTIRIGPEGVVEAAVRGMVDPIRLGEIFN